MKDTYHVYLSSKLGRIFRFIVRATDLDEAYHQAMSHIIANRHNYRLVFTVKIETADY